MGPLGWPYHTRAATTPDGGVVVWTVPDPATGWGLASWAGPHRILTSRLDGTLLRQTRAPWRCGPLARTLQGPREPDDTVAKLRWTRVRARLPCENEQAAVQAEPTGPWDARTQEPSSDEDSHLRKSASCSPVPTDRRHPPVRAMMVSTDTGAHLHSPAYWMLRQTDGPNKQQEDKQTCEETHMTKTSSDCENG